MISPDREEFRALARGHAVVPVWRELLADLTTPVSLYARCVGDGEGFLLESVDRGETWGLCCAGTTETKPHQMLIDPPLETRNFGWVRVPR